MSATDPRGVTVRVPATSANLGAGFDVLGLALGLYNTFHAVPAERTAVTIEGLPEVLPLDGNNLFCKAFAHLFALRGVEAPPLRVSMQISVPPARGLGSSATAVVGGLVAANAMLGNPCDNRQLLAEAVKLEHGGHADNVAPALLGGLIVNTLSGGDLIPLRAPFPQELKAVVFSPDFPMDTVLGRSLMPESYSKADVIFSTSRVGALLVALSEKRFEYLRVAMEDRLHQPYRAAIFPLLPRLIESALESGAYGACLSGGGSSVLALADARLDEIAASMQGTAARAGLNGRSYVLEIDRTGAQVIDGEHEQE